MSRLANRARGEAVVMLAGAERRLCLTLGALARMEAGLGVQGWAALSKRLAVLSAEDIQIVLAALLEGGGEETSGIDLARLDFREAANAVAAAFEAAG